MTELKDKRVKDWGGMSRRELLKLSPLLAAGALFIPKLQEPILARGVEFSDWASDKLFRKAHLAPTFPKSAVGEFSKFPYNNYDVVDPGVDLENWKLVVSGAVDRPGEYTIAQIKSLPKVEQNTRHICVEGWDVIGSFGGTRISDFLRFVGADTSVNYVSVQCADDYYESIDMASALHPQSLLCYEMYGESIDRGHGAPLRLQMPTKLGYKQAKYLTKLEVTNILPVENGYWEDQGYSWFGGL
jgi:DMSO/TMAO reductase YedYZ molybdopterin-dependent catalytic subunit